MLTPEIQKTPEIIEKNIRIGERKAFFHREPDMAGFETGVVCVDWMRGEIPQVTYYILDVDGEFGRFGPLMYDVFHPRCELWLQGEIDSLSFKKNGSEIIERWTKDFDFRTGSIELKGKLGNEDPYILQIEAESVFIIQDIPKK